MDNTALQTEAQKNLAWLRNNVYPGRGIVTGKDESGNSVVQVYWIMGRSDDSRNRVFVVDDGKVSTKAADPARVKDDPSLLIYTAMRETNDVFVVSNGAQTDAVIEGMDARNSPVDVLTGWDYEPDPNHTSRITVVNDLDFDPEFFQLHIIRKSLFGDNSDRFTYEYDEMGDGFGRCITTYTGDGNPLPPFTGEPLLMPLPGSIEEVIKLYWDALNEDNRISIAVKFIDIDTGVSEVRVHNKYHQVV